RCAGPRAREPLTPRAVNVSSVNLTLSSLGRDVDAEVTLDGSRRVIRIRPLASLEPYRLYSVTADVFDTTGNADTFSSISFTTGAQVDGTAPVATAISPPGGATGVPLNARVNRLFPQPIDPLSLGAFHLRRGAVEVAGGLVLSTDRLLLTFTPQSALQVGSHTITLTGIADVAGNAMTLTSVFSTG